MGDPTQMTLISSIRAVHYILKAVQFAVICINGSTFRLLLGNEGKKVYVPMNDEPSTVALNYITEAAMISVVIM